MYKIPANTVFVGKNLVFVPECHSTNTLALQMSQQPGFADGSVVITSNQTAGKGQRGNVWVAQPGVNLTFSVIFKPSFLMVRDQFLLTILTSLAVRDFLRSRLTESIYIKWPNDILVADKKICGILIENQIQGMKIQSSVIGIGLNVNQTDFSFAGATSVKKLLGADQNLPSALDDLLQLLERRYLQLKQAKAETLKAEYFKTLYWRDEDHLFRDATSEFRGVIQGVDEQGKLLLNTDSGIRSFEVKELRYVS